MIKIICGDITKQKTEAIVNPANSLGIMGGGVALAIKNAGGSIIEQEAKKQAPIKIGKAVLTSGGKLNARYVIHAPTMKKPSGKCNIKNIKLATKAALDCCIKNVKSVAFPGMGTGIGGISYRKAIDAMLEVMSKYDLEISIVAHKQEAYAIFKTAELWRRLKPRRIDNIDGLIIAIAQNEKVLMVAFQNREAIEKTIETGYMHYFSISRNKLWKKGETSKNVQKFISANIDCDGDAILYKVNQIGVACHTGKQTCFFKEM
jgi:O-acetyl-ADP-ribose deacetylase (regulator of RNase III)